MVGLGEIRYRKGSGKKRPKTKRPPSAPGATVLPGVSDTASLQGTPAHQTPKDKIEST
jgi:hypothetical protein